MASSDRISTTCSASPITDLVHIVVPPKYVDDFKRSPVTQANDANQADAQCAQNGKHIQRTDDDFSGIIADTGKEKSRTHERTG